MCIVKSVAVVGNVQPCCIHCTTVSHTYPALPVGCRLVVVYSLIDTAE